MMGANVMTKFCVKLGVLGVAGLGCALAWGPGCQLLVQVDSNQLPLPSLRDSAAAVDSYAPERDGAPDGGSDLAVDDGGLTDTQVDVD